jgi:hypothetical protein
MVTARPGKLIGAHPRDPAERWVATDQVRPPSTAKADTFTARLTIDVTPALRGRIKVAAFERGLTVADMLRALLEERFGDPSQDTGEATP